MELAKMLGPTGDCMPLDELVMRLEQPEGSEVRRQCEQHIASCAFCSSELALFRQFESAEPGPGEREAVAAIVEKLRNRPLAERKSVWSWLLQPKIFTPAIVAVAAACVVLVVNLNTRVDRIEMQVGRVMRSSQIGVIGPVG